MLHSSRRRPRSRRHGRSRGDLLEVCRLIGSSRPLAGIRHGLGKNSGGATGEGTKVPVS